MATYKNYIVKYGDTIESIAQKYLGDISKSAEIISLNRLRYPYISKNTLDTLGPQKGSDILSEPLLQGSIAMDFSNYIAQGSISSLVLSNQSIFYISTAGQYGSILENILKIKKFINFTTNEYPFGTLLFDVPLLNPPVASAEKFNLISTTQFCSFIGNISGTILTVTSIISGYISVGMSLSGNGIDSGTIISANITGKGTVGTYSLNISQVVTTQVLTAIVPPNVSLANRNYYISYTFTTLSGETIGSPLNFNENNGSAIPYNVPSATASSANKKLFVFSAPDSWPSAATSIKVYAGFSPQSLFYQATITTEQFASGQGYFVEPVNGIFVNTNLLPNNNTAYIGITHSYSSGTVFSIHENPEEFNTKIAIPGSTILLPTLSVQQFNFIINNKNPEQFVSSLGRDISLDQNGQILFDINGTGDIFSASGIDNLRQALLSRLLTKVEDLKTQPQYGNSALNFIGGKYNPSFLLSIRSEIIRSLQKDPRVYSIDNIRVNYDGSTQSIVIDNLSIKISSDGSSSSVLTFLPIALPI